MTRRRKCGWYPPAAGRNPYCPVCDRLGEIPRDAPEEVLDAALDTIGARQDRITRIHVAYRRRRR